MIIPAEGAVLKYRLTGNLFKIKKITGQFVILHSMDGSRQIMTSERGLGDFFEKNPRGGDSPGGFETNQGRGLRLNLSPEKSGEKTPGYF
jgi:hypothetical protein